MNLSEWREGKSQRLSACSCSLFVSPNPHSAPSFYSGTPQTHSKTDKIQSNIVHEALRLLNDSNLTCFSRSSSSIESKLSS